MGLSGERLTHEDNVEVNSKVCVVIPTYNEVENLPEIVGKLLALEFPELSILVVDDCSPDGTGAIADAMAQAHPGRIHVLHRAAKQGIGPAYVAGFKAAVALEPDVILQMDADLSHAPESIPAMIHALENADVVVGSRYVDGGKVDAHWGWPRRALSRYGNAYNRWVGGVPIHDASSGFKAFRRQVIEALPMDSLQCKGFGFQAEVTMACKTLGYSIIEYPIHFVDRQRGASKISWGIVWEALWRLPLIRIRNRALGKTADYLRRREN
jgi:dolichol-phosphate mannosyltransferase